MADAPVPEVVVEAAANNDAATFIGPKAEYYIPAFQRIDATGSMVSWNWSAFIGGILWMLYRKMYLYALIAWVACIVIGFIPVIGQISWIVQAVAFGILGNWLYKKKVEEELAAAATLDPAARAAQFAKRGGITWVPVIIVGVLTALALCALIAGSAILAAIFASGSVNYY